MSQDPKRNESRRERIMNSDKQLPGDADRARDEEVEDFDAPAGAILGGRVPESARGNTERREEINESDDVLPGDVKRGDDDNKVDRSIHSD